MKILYKGRMIEVEEGDDITEILYNTICKCGHALYLHGSVGWATHTIHTSQCTACGFTGEHNDKFVCEKFEVADAKE